MASAVIVLLPYCFLVALGAIAVLGKAFYITDEDLEHALEPARLGFIYRWILRYTGSPNEPTITASPNAADGVATSNKDKDTVTDKYAKIDTHDNLGNESGGIELSEMDNKSTSDTSPPSPSHSPPPSKYVSAFVSDSDSDSDS